MLAHLIFWSLIISFIMPIKFECKVTAIHPAFDANGNEYVCVEFSYESTQQPAVLTLPPEAPPEAKAFLPLLQSIPKAFLRPVKTYSNRLTIYLTPEEWDNLPTPYRVGDTFTVTIEQNGEILVKQA
ncbi:hypothetical protein B9Q11_04510 [Candidatus Marsarchaeota G2 archaeon ECH_B_SAG-F08]|jgi:hypothetical protein|uniref:Arcadin 1 domain-containing protein n=5 Tax=Candidatus Marsarchaeota TaxID=1978152 RepID=A0A2R6BFA5_9ARCH|nr:MAG: hypothetical protein B9Q11_04510 [Candidatus Marsarchaeota G2 archaeon ECH_B_SAG-F08]